MFQHECNKTGPLISSENEFEDFGLAAKTSLYMKRSIKKNSSKNWQRANNRGSPTTGCFRALTQAFPPSRTGRGQHIWYRQNLGSAVVLGQIKKKQIFYTVRHTPLHILSVQKETRRTHKTIPDKGKGGKLVQEHASGGLPRKALGGHFRHPSC